MRQILKSVSLCMIALSFHYSFAAEQVANSICSLGEEKILNLMSTGQPPDENLEFISALRSSSVIIAGETHALTDLGARKNLINLVKKIRGPKACVAFELPNRPGGLGKFISEQKEYARDERTEYPESANFLDDINFYYESMIDHAASIGLKVQGVDHPENFEKEISDQVRNPVMANNLIRLIQSKNCDAVLFFVGKAHENKSKRNQPAISQLLKSAAISSTTVNLQMSFERTFPADVKTWTCENQIERKIEKTVLLTRNQIPAHVQIAPDSAESVRFSDFNFTWLIPFQDREIPCIGCNASVLGEDQ